MTDEISVLTVSEHRDQLAEKLLFRLPPHHVVTMLHDKARFHEFATEKRLPVPQAEIVAGCGDLPKLRKLRFPVMIKPADKRDFHTGRVPRLLLAEDFAEAAGACEALLGGARELIVQERVDGPDDAIYFCLFYSAPDGRLVSSFTGRKLASNPPGTGSTALCMAAPEVHQQLETATRDLLERVCYAGFGSVEYKWDGRTRRFVIIEPTVGRTDWQEEIATLCGVNIPLAAFCFEEGMPPLPCTPSSKQIVWQASYLDRALIGCDDIPPAAAMFDGYCRLDDPLPAMVHYPADLFSLAAARWRKRLNVPGGPSKPVWGKQRAY